MSLVRTFPVKYYDGIIPSGQDAKLFLSQNVLELHIDSTLQVVRLKVEDLQLDEEFTGKRKIFLDRNSYIIGDKALTDSILTIFPHPKNRFRLFVELLERNWTYVAISFVLLIIASAAFIFKGVPYLSIKIAAALPVSANEVIGQQSIAGLERLDLLQETELSAEIQDRIRSKYTSLCEKELTPNLCKIFFKSSKLEGLNYNAFALPGGSVIFLDGMYKLAKNDEEILSILAHELGHQKYNHAMQSLIEGSIFTISMAMILGDVSSISNIAAAAPTLLVKSQFSRGHETQADDFGLKLLETNNISTVHFANIMERLAEKFKICDSNKCKDKDFDFISSHPDIKSRIVKARALAKS